MRHTGPVTDHEYRFPPGRSLVSTTDLKGRILYCNPAFIEVSGYAREELLGQPHNLIRHPDMPEEAFRDLWATIAAGRPWSGLVKNRRKNGDHYWVQANVTPLMEGDTPLGYMSVRTEPDRTAVEAAEALYRRMREEHAAGQARLRLEGGQLRVPGLPGMLESLKRGWDSHQLGVTLASVAALAYLGGAGPAIGVAAALPGAAVSLLAGAALGTTLSHARNRPLQGLLQLARRMAAGDLRQRIATDRRGVMGDLQATLNQLNVNLQAIVGDARTEVEQMEQAIAEIAAGNHDMSGRTESQASNLQETAASMEQITGTVRQNAESARQAAGLADGAAQVTQQGMAAVQRMGNTMRGISESSQRIGDISQVIDGIAFQTNLLALNAAVEAARVGEQGRGFGVVAGEVRALATRTADAAREIRNLVDTARGRIDTGVGEADEAARTMRHSADSVERVTRFVQDISHASGEQLTGVSQVNEAVTELDSLTQQNAAMVEQLSASADALRRRARVVAESVQVFHTGGTSTAHADAVSLRRQARAHALT